MVFVGMLIFTNINLFANSLSSSLDLGNTKLVKTRNSKTSQTNNSISTIIENNEIKLAEIQNLIDKYDT
jgi:non-ribosomal peptide synthetase component F